MPASCCHKMIFKELAIHTFGKTCSTSPLCLFKGKSKICNLCLEGRRDNTFPLHTWRFSINTYTEDNRNVTKIG